MAITLKNLAGKLINNSYPSNVEQSLYTPSASGKSGLVKNILLTNVHTIAVTVDIFYFSGSARFRIAPKTLSIPSLAQVVLDSEITLAYGQSITANNVSVDDKIECVINGLERDV